ncbi:MAG: MaoC/PaaZ C-terminal domain-containing protein [Aquiluna sp.]|nr:MaoC/PaaZ C-terminal domain-containing protein [Aquiluna sp.]
MTRYLEEFQVGESRISHGRTITEADIVLHAGQTGDFYPHHMDAVFCATQPFGQRMAHGTLVLSVGVGLLAGDVNEVALSYGYEKVRFIRPVFIGDTIRSRATVSGIRDNPKNQSESGFLDELVEVINQKDETVLAMSKIYLISKNPNLSSK